MFLYLTLTFYLLPALATTLKVRKRKLSQINVASDVNNLSNSPNFLIESIKTCVFNLNNKLSLLDLIQSQPTTIRQLNLLALKTESFRQFNIKIVGNSQLISFFF